MGKKLWLFIACALISTSMAFAQKTITGTVIEKKTGEPVIGASVRVDGTSIGQATDINGKFTIANVPNSAKNLQVTYVGMKPTVVPVKTVQTIYMEPDSKLLDEVFVVAYGTATKESFTGAATHINSEVIEDRQTSNVSNALVGNIAGVQAINSNGQPGTGSTIRIRGFGSINADMSPLYVLDGVPYDGDISAINPQDIEQISVLKDAAAAALYGHRGANGVILIETKKGSRNHDAKISFGASFGQNSREIKNYDVMGSADTYMEKLYQANYNAAAYNLGYGSTDAHSYANSKIQSVIGYPLYTVPDGESLIGTNGKINPNATLGVTEGDYYYTPDNWADRTYSNGARKQYDLGISGGTDKMTYYVSGSYLNDDGVIDHSGFERITARTSVDYQLKKWIKLGTNMSFSSSNSNYPGEQTSTNSSANAFNIANNIAPIYPFYVRNAAGGIKTDASGNPIYDYGNGSSTPYTRNWMSIANPTGDLVYSYEKYLSDIFNSQWYATITPIDGLSITAKLGLNLDNTRYNYSSSSLYGQSASYGGEAVQEHIREYGLTQQYLANYKFHVATNHNFDVLAGYEGYEWNNEWSEAYGQNIYKEGDYTVNNSIDQRRGYGAKNSYATEGFLARLNYDFNEQYFVSGSFRRDASSRFHKDNRWGNFWSGSLAWVISKENFMKNAKWVNFLKLRASYGQQGNDNIGNYYAYIDQYSMTGSDGVFSDGTLAYKGNKELTWEKSNSFDVGLDFELFHGVLSGSVEYFSRQTEDMLYNKPVATSNGYSSIPMNIGSMRNSGIEVDLSSTIINNDKVNWQINANATFLKNKIIKLAPELEGELISGSYIYKEGESMYQMYLVKYAGVDPSTGQALYWAKDKKDSDGNIIISGEYTTTDWSVARSSNRQGTGDLLPKVSGGFGTTLKFYGFDFAIQCSYQLGGKIYDSGYQVLMHGGSSDDAGQNWHTDIANSWTPTNTLTDIPRVCSTDQYTNSTSDRWLISSNYLAINNVTLGYSLPKSLMSGIDIETIRFYVSGDNLAVLSARKGLDPRQSYTTATTSLYTAIRTVSFGIKVVF